MLKYTTFVFFIVFLLLFGGCDRHDKKREETTTHKKAPNPNLIALTPIDANSSIQILKTQNGFVLKNDPKKILIFDIFATWCPPCRAESAVLGDIQKRFADNVLVIGLSIEDEIENQKLAAYKQKYHADYTLASSSPALQRLIDAVAENLKIGRRFPIPLVAIYKDGKLVNYYSGATEEEFIISDIKQAIGK